MGVKKCMVCGTEFSVYNYRLNTAKYCSGTCRAISRVGKHPSKETINRMKKSAENTINSGRFKTGHIPNNKGEIKTKEERNKIRQQTINLWKIPEYRERLIKAHTGRKDSKVTRVLKSLSHIGKNTGSANGAWQGGVSFKPYPLGWNTLYKEQIRYRDGYKCQICGKPEVENGRRLDIHHTDYTKENLEPNNLVSLCHSCHPKTNFNRTYWINYFKGGLLCPIR